MNALSGECPAVFCTTKGNNEIIIPDERHSHLTEAEYDKLKNCGDDEGLLALAAALPGCCCVAAGGALIK